MTTPQRHVVYVVDDDQGMLDSTVWLLESVGLNAVPFTSGQAFLHAVDPALNACVVLDIRMPAMGGLNVQQALQERGLTLPVIFVRAFKAGAHDFIEKPYNQQLLLDSVQQALSGGNARQSASQELTELEARLHSLTPRERDVLLPLVKGYTTREIAEQLAVSAKTIDLYRARVMKRMQAEHLPDLVGMAIAAGLVDPLKLRATL